MTAPATVPATTEERGLATSAVDPQIAAAMQVYDRLKPLQNALGLQDLSVAEMQLFGMVAYRTGLDPFTRQIYAIKRGGKVTHQTGIDGYRSVAERTGQYAGSEEAVYEDCPCGKPPAGHPSVARVTVHRILPGGHTVDQVGTARWHELIPQSGQDSMWLKMPFNQLAKCAEANALRKAFPRVLGDVYIAEEMEQAGPPQNGALAAAAAAPTARGRLAARRAAVEGGPEPIVIEGEAKDVGDTPAPATAGAPTSEAGDPVDTETGEVLDDGLTLPSFMALLEANRIAPQFAAAERKRLYPDANGFDDLDDIQRLAVWRALKPA